MAITVDWTTLTFTVPQADLTLIGGTLYEMNTETYFRAGVNAIMAGEEGIVFEDPIDHNTTYTVVGVTYARKIEMINGYSLVFSPNSAWSVRYTGSNNNLFDVQNGILNQNQVQVIPNNSAGLIESGTSGLTASESAQLAAIFGQLDTIEGTLDHQQAMRILLSALAGILSGVGSGTIKTRDQANTKDRITATVDGTGNRTAVTVDGS